MSRSAPADYREFIRLSVDLPDNPKLAMIDDPAAGWAYVVALCYCGRNLTDGAFPITPVVRQAGVKPATARKLVNAGLWHESGHTCERCPQPMPGMGVVHDYLEHQRSAAEAHSLREARREAGRKGAASRWDGKSHSNGHGKSHDNGVAGAMAGDTGPDQGNGSRSGLRDLAVTSPADGVSGRATSPTSAGTSRSEHHPPPEVVASAMASAMANGSQTDGTSMAEVEVDKKTTSSSSAKPPREDVEKLCAHFAGLVEANTEQRPNVTDRWRSAARLLLDKDLSKESDPLGLAIRLADWTANDEFWRSNVLSMPTFREKFTQLRLKARRQWERGGHLRLASGGAHRADPENGIYWEQ